MAAVGAPTRVVGWKERARRAMAVAAGGGGARWGAHDDRRRDNGWTVVAPTNAAEMWGCALPGLVVGAVGRYN